MLSAPELQRFAKFIVAICMVIIGIDIYLDPVFYSRMYGVQINFGQLHKLVGGIVVLIGGFILYFAYKDKAK